MNSPSARRSAHRKRISALRLSTDSTVPALPLYTSPQWQRPVELLPDPSDLPPDYPSSAEEADADTESDYESQAIVYNPLSFSPRRARRSRGSSHSRRQNTSNDPYLDSLLARSVHALEMSNTLLQSSMSTQSSLNNVLAGDSADADRSLESQARVLSARIEEESSYMDDLDQISKGVDSLFDAGDDPGPRRRLSQSLSEDPVSQSLPASSSLSTVADRAARRHLRRPSLDLRNASLHYSSHDRDALIAPPPRALTMYVDTTEDPETISMPSTIGLRSTAHVLQAPPETSQATRRPLLLHAAGSESALPLKSALDVLSSYAVPRRGSSKGSDSNSRTVSPSSSFRTRPRSGSASTSTTTATASTRKPRSPRATTPRSPSHSPSRSPCRSLQRTWDTPPILELPSASSSSSSEDLHVDRTLCSLRTILQNNPPPPPSPPKVPDFLKLPAVMPVADTSNATASVSRLFTKPRHTSSTRPPSPPRVSAMKGRSGRSAPPTPISPALSLSSSWLSISDAVGISTGTSGRNTPNRVSFAELPDGASRDGKDKSTLKTRSKGRKGKGKGKSKSKGSGHESDGEGGRWWSWLLGPAPTSVSAVPAYIKHEERIARGSGWGRPGFGGSIEEWGV